MPRAEQPRRATLGDLDFIVELVAAFHETPRWPGVDFDADDFRFAAARIIETGAVFLTQRGLIGLIVTPSIYNRKARVASEMFFWAPDGQGDALRRAAEAWAASPEVAAHALIMNAHQPGEIDRIERWYVRKGYRPMGRQYVKVTRWAS